MGLNTLNTARKTDNKDKVGKLLLLFQDENRFSTGRIARLNLKRAEKARLIITKIPGTFHRTPDAMWFLFCHSDCISEVLQTLIRCR